ncbi:hypothetical protein [uncultured Helicobacter sp.]|uniref:hypothetical protein n=1 Tax=uncultured Helicobacter sp. TaxID=175537 RepID=UPI002610E142|nr:hypothetical protein [uncultured Helicobacter sp.]
MSISAKSIEATHISNSSSKESNGFNPNSCSRCTKKTSQLPNLGLFKPQKLSDIFLIFIYFVLEKAYLINKNKSIFLEFQTLFIGNLPHILYSYQLKFFKCFKHYTKHTPCFLLKNDQMIVELKSQSPKV